MRPTAESTLCDCQARVNALGNNASVGEIGRKFYGSEIFLSLNVALPRRFMRYLLLPLQDKGCRILPS